MGNFRFKNYTFKFNPNTFSISQNRRVKNFFMPFGKTATQDLGFEPLIISGEGELIETQTDSPSPNQNLMEQYQKLFELMQEKNSGPLYIPQLSPIYCYFTELSIIGKAGPKILKYKFEFAQDCSREMMPLTGQKAFTIAEYGDTIEIISIKNNLSAAQILALNPNLDNSIDIESGSIIWLS